MSVIARKALMMLAVGAMLTACGVRGPLQNPRPDAASPPTPGNSATAESGQGKAENTAPKPHSGFILDGLLR